MELGYLVEAVGREAPVLPWNADGSVWEGADMWALASESREYLVDLYRSVWALTDASIAALPLDAPATVAWWPAERRETTFGHLLVRCVAETAQHAGHADILREGLDGQGGATTTTWATPTRGRRTWRGSSRRRTSTARLLGAQRAMSAIVASVTRTRSAGESPRSRPRRPPDT